MARKQKVHGFNKFSRSVGLWCAFLMILSCFTLMGTLIMDMIGLNPYELDEPRQYTVQFQVEEKIESWEYRRGADIMIPPDPKHSEDEYFEFTFRGWDYTGDNSPDIIPTRAYFHFRAVAVFQKRQIKPFPSSNKDSSNPDEYSSGLLGA